MTTYWSESILRVFWWYINVSQNIIPQVWRYEVSMKKYILLLMLKYQISILMVLKILYWYLLILIQYWEKTLNTIKILIWYFSISNNIYFFILTSCLHTWGMIFWETFMYHQNTLKILSLQYVVIFAVLVLWSIYHHVWVSIFFSPLACTAFNICVWEST